MQIVVNDTNLFIDLIHAELIDVFFQLPFEVHTTDFVVGEIEEPEQEDIINHLIETSRLFVARYTFNEVEEIMSLQEAVNRLSIPDCSVWHYSKKHNYTLLTGDNLLRRTALKDQVVVRGLLYIFDELIRLELITPAVAYIKLRFLLETGTRLPKEACDERFELWSS
jgi:rRNA-processing protein FCF1